MKMKIKRLNQLKEILVQEKDLSNIWDFFMDHFADHPEFLEYGDRSQSPLLEAVLPEICKQIFGKEVIIQNLLLIYIPEYEFFHGPFYVQGQMGSAIYFEDINTGAIAISEPPPSNGEVKYSRFSAPLMPYYKKNPYEYN